MKFGMMFKDVAASLVKKPVTERYPYVHKEAPPRLRGRLVWQPENCTGCQLCAMDCPAGALEMIVLDKSSKRFVLTYHLDRCTFCAQCVHSCRQGCLAMAADAWELAALDKVAFALYFGEEGDVREVLERETAGDAG